MPRALPFGGRASVAEDVVEELRTLAPLCPAPERTLIVARHGLEWWVAWTLHTHIAQPTAVTTADWSAYSQVLYLLEKRPAMSPDRHEPSPENLPTQVDTDRPARPPCGPRHELTLTPDTVLLHSGATLTLFRQSSAPSRLVRDGPPEQRPRCRAE